MRCLGVVFCCVLTACYSPGYKDCEVTCATGAGCPDGLSCLDHVCRLAGHTGACGAVDDGGPDGAACDLSMWSYTPVNVHGCAYQTSTVDWTIGTTGTVETIATGDPVTFSLPNPPPFSVVMQNGGPELLVVTVGNFTMATGTTLRVTGSRALVIIANGNVVVDGINAAAAGMMPGPGVDSRWCDGSNGDPVGLGGAGGISPAGSAGGAGGAGGGSFGADNGMAFGKPGGTGADSTAVNGVAGTNGLPNGAMGQMTLSPLRGGCAGGQGGNQGAAPTTQLGSAGGGAGGAIQISARGTINVNGEINVGGGGGTNTTGPRAGAGGGGSGGGIVVEAQSVTLSNTGALCANGGGGGASGSTNPPTTAQDGLCAGPAAGGNPTATSSGGGAGAYHASEAGLGKPGVSTSGYGGGGGGGGVGRIRVHGTLQSSGGHMSPTPITIP